MKERLSILGASRTRVAASLYMAVFLVMIAFCVRYYVPQISPDAPYQPEQQAAKYFKYLPIEAKAVYVYDALSKEVIWQSNASLPLPLASVTKIMTALCALDNLDKDGYVTLEQSKLTEYRDPDLIPGEKLRISDLVAYTLVKSSNSGAEALSNALGGTENMVSCMNTKATNLELFDTKFENETGLDIGNKPGAYGSAEDAAKLLISAYGRYPDVFGTTRYESYNVEDGAIFHEAINTNKVQSMIVGIQSGKTGLTDLAGGNLVFVMDAGLGHTVGISILGSTEEGRFNDALLLSKAVIDYLGSK